MRLSAVFILLGLLIFLLFGCTPAPSQSSELQVASSPQEVSSATTAPTLIPTAADGLTKPFTLASPVLEADNMVPTTYSCNGKDISLPLAWGEPPQGTQSLALIMDDPDAKTVAGIIWIHWVIFNIPPQTRNLAENIPKIGTLPDGSLQGKNSFGRIGYGGPCPPSGLHHYFFKLYALDTILNASPGAASGAIIVKISGHILAQTELVTVYRKH